MGGTRLRRRKAETLYLRVARIDWPAVSQGIKTEFRAAGQHKLPVSGLYTPCPVVCWCPTEYGPEPDQQLMVLEAAWSEPLGAISPESLAREGFNSRRDFIHYWRNQRIGRRAFPVDSTVFAYRVSLWDDNRRDEFAHALLMRLYGWHLDDAEDDDDE